MSGLANPHTHASSRMLWGGGGYGKRVGNIYIDTTTSTDSNTHIPIPILTLSSLASASVTALQTLLTHYIQSYSLRNDNTHIIASRTLSSLASASVSPPRKGVRSEPWGSGMSMPASPNQGTAGCVWITSIK